MTTHLKIYLASSWRNPFQPLAVNSLRALGHQVYDFRNPRPGNTGFRWEEIDKDWLSWNPWTFVKSLSHPKAGDGFRLDRAGLDWCDICVLLLPCGRSAHLEAGYCSGRGKPVLVVISPDDNGLGAFEPELMYLLAAKVYPRWHDLWLAIKYEEFPK